MVVRVRHQLHQSSNLASRRCRSPAHRARPSSSIPLTAIPLTNPATPVHAQAPLAFSISAISAPLRCNIGFASNRLSEFGFASDFGFTPARYGAKRRHYPNSPRPAAIPPVPRIRPPQMTPSLALCHFQNTATRTTTETSLKMHLADFFILVPKVPFPISLMENLILVLIVIVI
jgi:hypothetical protein